ncbi:MAG: hypothetical protein H0X51_08200 [Parachlamydiaceae bacterium]|nr:hypothetical protein [Parachlamydiaceae bacterium]
MNCLDRFLSHFNRAETFAQQAERIAVTKHRIQCFAPIEDANVDGQYATALTRYRLADAVITIAIATFGCSGFLVLSSAFFVFSATPQLAFAFTCITNVALAALAAKYKLPNPQDMEAHRNMSGAIAVAAAVHGCFLLSLTQVGTLSVATVAIGLGLHLLKQRVTRLDNDTFSNICDVTMMAGISFFAISCLFKFIALRKVYEVATVISLLGLSVSAIGVVVKNKFFSSLVAQTTMRIQKLWKEGLNQNTAFLIRGLVQALPQGHKDDVTQALELAAQTGNGALLAMALNPQPDAPPGPYIRTDNDRYATLFVRGCPTKPMPIPVPTQWSGIFSHWRNAKSTNLENVICHGIMGTGRADPDYQKFQLELVGR